MTHLDLSENGHSNQLSHGPDGGEGTIAAADEFFRKNLHV